MILDEYVMNAPSNQHAIDLFKGEWSSMIPGPYTSGECPLFQDTRMALIEKEIGGFQSKKILELGPLEAAHTAFMAMSGGHVIAIEANSRAYMKCLIVKEILKLVNVQFLLGNFDIYLEDNNRFDFILASGVLYHCTNPLKTLSNLCKNSDVIGIWSHYYMDDIVPIIYGDRFETDPEVIEYNGMEVNSYKHNYGKALDSDAFCGGGNAFTRWMDRESWLSIMDKLGYEFNILSESITHPHGPEFTAVARRKPS